MFMRGTMDNNESGGGLRIVQVELEWKVDAVTDPDPKKFAEDLQRLLNEGSAQGYIVSSMLTRAEGALVVIQQRRLINAADMPADAILEGTKVH